MVREGIFWYDKGGSLSILESRRQSLLDISGDDDSIQHNSGKKKYGLFVAVFPFCHGSVDINQTVVYSEPLLFIHVSLVV